MSLNDPKELQFERLYKKEFASLASKYGTEIEYDQDLAAIDIGLHLSANDKMTNVRVWFQLKGLHSSTLTLEDFKKKDRIAYKCKIEHLRAWYISPEPVYLVLYLESAEIFLAEDVRVIVDRQWGDELLQPTTFEDYTSDTVTIYVLTTAIINQEFWPKLYAHKSMRIDGNSFRGKPLAHNRDPITSSLKLMDPPLFESVVQDLLQEHDYKQKGDIPIDNLFQGASGNRASLSYGTLNQKYEIVLQVTNSLVTGVMGDEICEGVSEIIHGPCAVLIHSRVSSPPDAEQLKQLSRTLSKDFGITRLMAFVNGSVFSNAAIGGSCLGVYLHALGKTPLRCVPQHLEDIGFNLTTTTNTYLRYRDKVAWQVGDVGPKENSDFESKVCAKDGNQLGAETDTSEHDKNRQNIHEIRELFRRRVNGNKVLGCLLSRDLGSTRAQYQVALAENLVRVETDSTALDAWMELVWACYKLQDYQWTSPIMRTVS